MKLKELILANLFGLAIVCVVTGIIGGLGWTYTLNHWLIFAHRPPCMTFFKGFLIGLIPPFGMFSVLTSLITFILSLFIG